MLGAIAGDVIGSVHEHAGIKTADFPLFSPASTFTDDTVLTLAIASALLRGTDYATALKEWRPLAEQGDAGAQNILGLMYATGEGVPQDNNEAVRWYRLAAEQGDDRAQYILGVRVDPVSGDVVEG